MELEIGSLLKKIEGWQSEVNDNIALMGEIKELEASLVEALRTLKVQEVSSNSNQRVQEQKPQHQPIDEVG